MSTSRKTPVMLRGAWVLAAVLALAAGYWISEILLSRTPDVSHLQATVFSAPRTVQPFALVDHTGKAFDNRALEGRWSFIFFGYTHCPDVCPTTLATLNSVAHKLEGDKDRVQFVFISVDPERDTPEQLHQFISYFNGAFIGVTGSEDAINALTRQLGVVYARVAENSGSNDYVIDHSASVLLFDPQGRFHAVFTPPLNAAAIASDFKAISNVYE